VMGLLVAVLIGVVLEASVYRPVAKRSGANALLAVFVAALMLTIVGEALVNLIWGLTSSNRQLNVFTVNTHAVGNITFTNLDIVIVVASWLAILALVLFLRSAVGRKVRAVRSNPVMAEAVGIGANRIYLVVFAVGSLMSGIAGVLYTLKYAAVPDMGERPVFYAIVVAFLAGTQRGPLLVGASGLALGLIESWSGEWLSAQWSSLVVFGLLFLYLARRAAALELAEHRVFQHRKTALAREGTT
jgi:branched-chain amino acid transport system permease protein